MHPDIQAADGEVGDVKQIAHPEEQLSFYADPRTEEIGDPCACGAVELEE